MDAPESNDRGPGPGAPAAPSPGAPSEPSAVASAPGAADPPPRRRRRGPLLVVVVLLLGAAGAGGKYWLDHRAWESTDDAFVDGDVVTVSPRVAGVVLRSHVEDNQPVAAGDLLFELDPADFESRVVRARATLEAAQKNLEAERAGLALMELTTAATVDEKRGGVAVARATLERRRADVVQAQAQAEWRDSEATRYQKLYARKQASRQQLDRAIADARGSRAQLESARRAVAEAKAQIASALAELAQAQAAPQQLAVKRSEVGLREAEVDQARADLHQAELDLAYTKIRAPHTGVIAQRSVHEGSTVKVGQSLAAIVYGTPWVRANFKETQLERMRPGQRVAIEVDAYPGVTFSGRVESMQAGTGSHFSLLPPENATGNYVKVVQRVPVKIVFDPPPPKGRFLALGMSVVPRVDVGAPPIESPLAHALLDLVSGVASGAGAGAR